MRSHDGGSDRLRLRPQEPLDLLPHLNSDYGGVVFAAFSADGTRLITVVEDGVAVVWDTLSGQRVGEIRPDTPLEGRMGLLGHAAPFRIFVEGVALNSSGELALLGLNDGTAGVFRVADGARLSTFHHPHRQPAQALEVLRNVAFSADSQLAAVAFYPPSVGIWDVQTGRPINFLSCDFGGQVTSLAFSPCGRFVFVGLYDLSALLWDRATGELICRMHEHSEAIVALWERSGVLRWATGFGAVWHCESGRATKVFAANERWQAADFSPDGESLLVQANGDQVKRWFLDGRSELLADMSDFAPGFWFDSRRCVGHINRGGGEVVSYHPSSFRSLVLSGSKFRFEVPCSSRAVRIATSHDRSVFAKFGNKSVRLWRLDDGKLLGEITSVGEHDYLLSLALSFDGTLVALGVPEERIEGESRTPCSISVRRIDGMEEVCRWQAHRDLIQNLAFLPDGGHIVSTGCDNTVRLWQLPGPERGPAAELVRLKGRDLATDYLHVLADGRILVFRWNRIEVSLGLAETTAELAVRIYFETRLQVTEDERYLLILRGQQAVEQWDLRIGRLETVHQAAIHPAEVLPGHAIPMDWRPQAGCYLWRLGSNNFLHVGGGPRGWATPLHLSPDGTRTLVPCHDRAVLLGLDPVPVALGEFPFSGQLRASCVTADHVLAVNSHGRLYRATML